MYPGALATNMPATLGRYELLLPVARGGMGQVWAARLRGARGFNKLVAIKTVLPLPGAEGRLESMLLEEARIAALIHHPNVVQTLELGEYGDTLYLVMEWVDGEPLSFLFERTQEGGSFPLLIAVNLVGQTLLGLHAAHELSDESGAPLGVVHRDVSPHNVLVTHSGVAKLVDFGIAKATKKGTSTTQTGEVKGKFSYMAPEQIRSEAVDRRADIFAAGILLYTLTTGQHPFKSEHAAALIQSIASDDPAPRPSLSTPGYSRTLEAVVMKALEKDPDARFHTAAEMLTALQRAMPLAFAPGFEEQVRDFVANLTRERAAQRREALRRAQLAADARSSPESVSHGSQSPGQSASSLRALIVDTAPTEESQSRASGESTMASPNETRAAAPRRSRSFKSLASVAALLVCAVVLFRTVAQLDVTARRAAASPDMNRTSAHASAPSVPAASQATASIAAVAPASSTMPSIPATAETAVQPSGSAELRPASTSAKKPLTAANKLHHSRKKTSDLMSPY
ncbi:MAG TPA: protein kinase [Polyangiaceae bacterium]|nr:protein kinase [Polyangiaceae bacterium]